MPVEDMERKRLSHHEYIVVRETSLGFLKKDSAITLLGKSTKKMRCDIDLSTSKFKTTLFLPAKVSISR